MKEFMLGSVLVLEMLLCGDVFAANCSTVPKGFGGYENSRVVETKREKILGEWLSVSYYDREGDGVNDVAEIRSIFYTGKLLYCGYDRDRDGVFSFNELVASGDEGGLDSN